MVFIAGLGCGTKQDLQWQQAVTPANVEKLSSSADGLKPLGGRYLSLAKTLGGRQS